MGASVTEPPKRYVGAWIGRQPELFPSLDEQLDPLTAKLERLIVILDTLGLEAYVAPPGRGRGRPGAVVDARPTIGRRSPEPSSPKPYSTSPHRGADRAPARRPLAPPHLRVGAAQRCPRRMDVLPRLQRIRRAEPARAGS